MRKFSCIFLKATSLTFVSSSSVPYLKALEHSWAMFLRRTERLRHQAEEFYGAAAERVAGSHASALQTSKRLVVATPYLRDLFPSDSDMEMLLTYFYLLIGAAVMHLVTSFVRYVLYA